MVHCVHDKVELLDLLMIKSPSVQEENQSVNWNKKKNIIFIPNHDLDKKTRDNVSSLAV
jgi:hypothetical protein